MQKQERKTIFCRADDIRSVSVPAEIDGKLYKGNKKTHTIVWVWWSIGESNP